MEFSIENINLSTTTRYQAKIEGLDNVSYFITKVNIPQISTQTVKIEHPHDTLKLSGDKLEFDSLTMNFLVDENHDNYFELHDWLRMLTNSTYANPNQNNGYKTALETIKPELNSCWSVSRDIVLFVYNSSNNLSYYLRFNMCVIESLSQLDLDSTDTSEEPLIATVVFDYFTYDRVKV